MTVGPSDHGPEDTMMTERNVGGAVEAETLFRPVNTGRISEEIVEQIKLAIRAGQVRLGDRLPSERDFAEQFGVSRVSVRDALRILETSGLIEIRVGARGGAYVTAPPSTLVGERATDEDLDELGVICKEQKQALARGDYSVELSARFHVALARATHNTA